MFTTLFEIAKKLSVFTGVTEDPTELSVKLGIALIADIFEIDMEEILNKIADDNQSITKIIKMKAALNAA